MKESLLRRDGSTDASTAASMFLYSAPKKYRFAPTTKYNGAKKSKKKKKSRTPSVKAGVQNVPEATERT